MEMPSPDIAELESVDISRMPEVQRLVQHVRDSNRPTSLRIAGQEVGVLQPPRQSKGARQPSRRRTGPRGLTTDDALWRIVGLHAGDGETTDVASDKYRYLADAYAPAKE
jgi:hypothetical protein